MQFSSRGDIVACHVCLQLRILSIDGLVG